MKPPAVYVGVDVGKQQLEVALRPGGEQFSLPHDERAVRALVKQPAPLGCVRIVVEATGGYETLLVAALPAGGLPVVLVNPRWTRAFAKAIGQLAKTDRIDARILALYAERVELKLRELPDEQTRELRACVRAAMTCWTCSELSKIASNMHRNDCTARSAAISTICASGSNTSTAISTVQCGALSSGAERTSCSTVCRG
jgi:hypothetical protein